MQKRYKCFKAPPKLLHHLIGDDGNQHINIMSASVTLTKKLEFRNLKEHFKSDFEGIFKSMFKVPLKIEIEI